MPSGNGGARRCASRIARCSGHMRHESGHYYWDRLIQDGARSTSSAALFGDERLDYAAALQHLPRAGRAGRLAGAVRQRLRQRPPLGGLGRNLGALPAHGRHARNRAGLRHVAAAETIRRAVDARRSAVFSMRQPFDRLLESWMALTPVG